MAQSQADHTVWAGAKQSIELGHAAAVGRWQQRQPWRQAGRQRAGAAPGQLPTWALRVLQEEVGVVLQQQDAVPLAQAVHGAPALHGDRAPGRVLQQHEQGTWG